VDVAQPPQIRQRTKNSAKRLMPRHSDAVFVKDPRETRWKTRKSSSDSHKKAPRCTKKDGETNPVQWHTPAGWSGTIDKLTCRGFLFVTLCAFLRPIPLLDLWRLRHVHAPAEWVGYIGRRRATLAPVATAGAGAP
jgi:hypothetical protein